MGKDTQEKKLNRLFILDNETKFLAKGIDTKKTKTICDRKTFNQFINSSFQVKDIIILVELDWDTHVSRFHGYEIARILMEYSEEPFNLHFISTLRRDIIYEIFQETNRIFTQKFSHERIKEGFDLTNIEIQDYSEKKFNYLKNYSLIKTGIIDKLEHDFRSPNPDQKSALIKDLRANHSILTEQINTYTDELEKATDKEEIEKLYQEIRRHLEKLRIEYSDDEKGLRQKSYNKVLLIEDNKETLEKLEKQLGNYFKNITPISSGTEAKNELLKNGKAYDVVITDMELLDSSGKFDDPVQGIDILELCEDKYPHIATRIISALPKNALKKLTDKTLDEIIFKGKSDEAVIPPFEKLVEFVDEIDEEVKQKRILRNLPGPSLSPKSNWDKFLTKKLHLYKINQPDEFQSLWRNIKQRVEAFIKGEFDNKKDSEKLQGALFQTKADPEKAWNAIDELLTHRLIALNYAAKRNWRTIYFKGGADAYVTQKGFSKNMHTRQFKNYFATFLGINTSDYSKKRDRETENDVVTGVLKNTNLFPWEIEWLNKAVDKTEALQNIPLRDYKPYLFDFMETLLGIYKKEDIDEEIKLREAKEELIIFNKNYRVSDEDINSGKYTQLKFFFTEYYEDRKTFEPLPEEIDQILHNIKKDFFSK